MWWSCSCISPFWRLVFNLLTELMGLHIPLIPELAVLDIDTYNIPPHFQPWFIMYSVLPEFLLQDYEKLPLHLLFLNCLTESTSLVIVSSLSLSLMQTMLKKKGTAWSPWTASKYFTWELLLMPASVSIKLLALDSFSEHTWFLRFIPQWCLISTPVICFSFFFIFFSFCFVFFIFLFSLFPIFLITQWLDPFVTWVFSLRYLFLYMMCFMYTFIPTFDMNITQ